MIRKKHRSLATSFALGFKSELQKNSRCCNNIVHSVLVEDGVPTRSSQHVSRGCMLHVSCLLHVLVGFL
jgi:hypothetical protein